jgi:hypothetical protein
MHTALRLPDVFESRDKCSFECAATSHSFPFKYCATKKADWTIQLSVHASGNACNASIPINSGGYVRGFGLDKGHTAAKES